MGTNNRPYVKITGTDSQGVKITGTDSQGVKIMGTKCLQWKNVICTRFFHMATTFPKWWRKQRTQGRKQWLTRNGFNASRTRDWLEKGGKYLKKLKTVFNPVFTHLPEHHYLDHAHTRGITSWRRIVEAFFAIYIATTTVVHFKPTTKTIFYPYHPK